MADPRLSALSVLLELERMARKAEDPAALRYVLVNETKALVPYRQAAFWELGSGRVTALSGMSLPDRNAPFVAWLERLMAELHRRAVEGRSRDEYPPLAVQAADMPEDISADWGDWLPAHALSVPIGSSDGVLRGILLLARATPFSEHEPTLLSLLAEAYGHALQAVQPSTRPEFSRAFLTRKARELLGDRKKVRWVAGGLLVLLLFPVRISSLAPAEVASRDPWVVRSPLDGVVRGIDVPPNSTVKRGAQLVTMERTVLENALAVTRQERMVSEAEYRRAAQGAVYERENMSEMSVLSARVGRLRAEEAYASEQLRRTLITAERSGVAVYGNPDDWNGRPVRTGERIMTIMDPKKAKLSVWLGVDDAISLEPGAEVVFFLSSNPLRPVRATLEYASYSPEIRPDGTLAYSLEAKFRDGTDLPRVGLKGTAKIYGNRVPLSYYLLRRPLAALRRWTGM